MQPILRAITAALVLFIVVSLHAANAQSAPFEIDAIVSITGSGTFLGKAQADALGFLETYVNKTGGIRNRPIKFNVHDDQSSPQIAVQLFNEALQRKPQVVIGSSLTAACKAIEPMLTDGPVVYCFSAGVKPPAGSYMFAYGVSTAGIIRDLVTYFRGRGWTRLGAIFTTDASGQDGEEALQTVLAMPANKSMTVVDREHFNGTDISISAQLSHLKAANPQLIFAWGTGTPLGTVLRGANDIGLSVPFATSAANLDYGLMAQYAGFLPTDLFMVGAPGIVPDAVAPGPLKNAASTFYQLAKATGAKPASTMLDAFDPAMLVIGALRKLGPGATSAQIRQYLATLHGWYGAAGIYDFRDGSQRGLSGDTSVVVRFDRTKQEFVPVSGIGGTLLPGTHA